MLHTCGAVLVPMKKSGTTSAGVFQASFDWLSDCNWASGSSPELPNGLDKGISLKCYQGSYYDLYLKGIFLHQGLLEDLGRYNSQNHRKIMVERKIFAGLGAPESEGPSLLGMPAL